MNGIDIKIARIRADLKQFELAQRAGIREVELSLYERGRKRPSAEKIARIEAALASRERELAGGVANART